MKYAVSGHISMRLKSLLPIVMLIFFSFFLEGCHTSKKAKSRPGQPHIEQIQIKHTSKVRKKIVQEAATWLGTPYKYGGSERGEGADCSGFVMVVYQSVTGEKLPRNSTKQSEYCQPIDASEIKAGDLVFFATGKDPQKVSHVGIILDDESFIHASSSKGITVSKLSSNYFVQRFRMFGRTPGMKKL